LALTAPPDEEMLTRFLVRDADVVIDGLSGLLGELEANRATGLSLPHGGPIGGVAVWTDVLDLYGDDIAAS
jgi:hypothetical protein